MNEVKIYVGLNDSVTLTQLFDNEKYIKILKYVCTNYHVPFSFSLSQGGYYHESGEFTQENTLVLTLIDVSDDVANEIAKDLCVFFHQESVMITYGQSRMKMVRESLSLAEDNEESNNIEK